MYEMLTIIWVEALTIVYLLNKLRDYKDDLEDALREQQYFKEMYYNERAKVQSWDEKIQQIRNLMRDKNET